MMNIRSSNHRNKFLLFLILSSLSISADFTDSQSFQAYPSNIYTFSFNLPRKKKSDHQNNRNNAEEHRPSRDFSDEQKLLEYDFDLINQIIHKRYKPNAPANKLPKKNVVYATIPAAVTAAAALAQGAAIAATAVVMNKPEEKKVEQQKQKPARQQPKTKATFPITPQQTFKKDPVFSPANNTTAQVTHTFQTQSTQDREKRDHAIESAASFVAYGLQHHQAQQNQTRKAKKIAEWSKEKEADIQKRMRAGSKTRFQIEEEDRLFSEKCEQVRLEEARQKEEKKKKKVEQPNKPKQNSATRPSSSGPSRDPDDEEDKKKHPHGKYENNHKHHQNSRGNIGKQPRDGQKALDNSIAVPGKDYRLAVQDGKIIKLRLHEHGKYHGYIVEDVKGMIDADKNALYNAGFIRSRSSCKVIKG